MIGAAKYDRLKKKAIVEVLIVLAVVIVLGAVVYVISSVDDDYDETNAALQKQVDAIDLEMRALRGRFTNIKQNMDLYNEVEKRIADSRMGIDRKVILEKFNQFKAQYQLGALHLTVSPPQDVANPTYKHKMSNVNFSDVTANFETITDEGIYQMLDSFHDELPGVCKLVRINLVRQKPLDDIAIKELSQKGTYPMVKTDLHFIWFGVNYVPPPEPPKPGPPNVPATAARVR